MAEVRPKRRYARMKVLIGVDPHNVSVAVAAIDEATGELFERASFPQEGTGLRRLERFKRNDSPSVALSGGERRRPRGRHLAVRLAAAGECVVDVPPKLSARVRVLSSFAGNARKNDGVDALATALWPPRATSDWRP
jgi:transposase